MSAATQAMAAQPAPEYRVSLSISGFIAAGAIWPNFEYIIDGRNSLLVEGAYYAFGPSQGDYEGAVGYRRYASDHSDGLFVGGFARAGHQSGDVSDGKYSYKTPFYAIGANAGYKWQWNNGLNFTARLGYGYPFTDVEWTPTRPKSDWIAPFTAALMGVDAELNLGYAL